MSRRLTIAHVLSRTELIQLILDGIKDSGWSYTLPHGSDYTFPVEISITNGTESQTILVYIWNISHGGRGRSKEEYRIQIKGNPPLQTGNKYKTLLLGWFDKDKVFAAFDAYKHRNFTGLSPSVQVPIGTLNLAATQPFAFHTKEINEGKEVVVAFTQPYIIEYINNLYPQYHAQFAQGISNAEAETIETFPLDREIPDSELNRLPAERQTAIVTMSVKVRERKFQRNVWTVYHHGICAICGLQANLTEAAHIIPVSGSGTDEIVNGIQLCRNHHKAFDDGLIAVSPNYIILLNTTLADKLVASRQDSELKNFIDKSRIGQQIILPSDGRFYPKKEYLARNCQLRGIQPTLV
jgi:putative restriction endonuclease